MQTNYISLGKPITIPVLIPVHHKSTPKCINSPFMVNGEAYSVTAMSLGTTYGAVMVDDINQINITAVGHALSTHPLFPEGANIVFIQMLDKSNFKARLFVRGAGEAISSPEAAGVAATTVMMLQKTWENEVNTQMGETFRIKWDRCDGEVFYRI